MLVSFIFIKIYTFITLTDISSSDTIFISEGDIKNKGGFLLSKEQIALTEAVYYILLSLYEPLHGYGIMQNVEELSDKRVKLAPGTLYGALNTLLEKNWIESLPGEKNKRKKEYIITTLGKTIVDNEIIRLKELVKNGTKITKIKRG